MLPSYGRLSPVTQGHGMGGNPFGNKGGRWMPAHKFRALVNAGLTYDEIADINERSEGWRPGRSSVKYHLDTLNLEPRRASHRGLLPWKIRPEHNDALLRHMLQAESRSRQGKELSETDRKLVSRLHELLFGRGKLMVVGYHPEVGFYTTERTDADEDIIRMPRTDVYSSDAPEVGRSARGAAAPADGDGGPPEPPSGTEVRTLPASGRPRRATGASRTVSEKHRSGTARATG